MLTELSPQRTLVVGSSFGGFVAARAALRLKEKIAGLFLVNPSIDQADHFKKALERGTRRPNLFEVSPLHYFAVRCSCGRKLLKHGNVGFLSC